VSASGRSLGAILDDASELVGALLTPWAALVWLSAAPLRLAQAHFVARLGELGDDAAAYGDHLHALALATAVALVVSLYGRAVFARACSRRLRGLATSGREPLRVPFAAFATYAYAALAIEAAFFATLVTLACVPALVIVAGLAAAASPQIERPGLLRPFELVAAGGSRVGPLLGMLVVFTVAALLVAINLLALAQAGLWLAGGLAGFDVARWQALLAPSSPRMLLVAAAGGVLLVEPWWLASLVVLLHDARARSTGEDLRLWFERLRSTAP
jgi:hypothetical protein